MTLEIAPRMPNLSQAACMGTEPSTVVCGRCWDRPECLAWALESERVGFWGGYSAYDRRALRNEFGIPAPELR